MSELCPQCYELIELLMDAVIQGAISEGDGIVDHACISTWEHALLWLEQRGFAEALGGRRYRLLWERLPR